MGLFGPSVKQITDSTGTEDIAIASHGPTTVYSKAFKLDRATAMSIFLKAAGSSPRLSISIEQSYRLPTTEGSSDSEYVVPEGNSAIMAALADTNAHIILSLGLAVMPYGRLKIVSNGSNGANTTLNAKLCTQEES